jgi:hypothetical protein
MPKKFNRFAEELKLNREIARAGVARRKARPAANRAPIGSVWMGKNVEGEPITLEVLGDPIPGNDLRLCALRPSGVEKYIGANWFKRYTRIS